MDFESEDEPYFSPDIEILDITDSPFVQEGWDYIRGTGEFKEASHESPVLEEPQPSIEEQILTENQYQTALLEMNMIGGV